MTTKEIFRSKYMHYKLFSLPQQFSDEEMIKDWTLSMSDLEEIRKYRKNSRLYIAIQLCIVRLYGRFLAEIDELSPRIITYLVSQLKLSPSLTVAIPEREATYLKHRKNILNYLKFHRFDNDAQIQLQHWIEKSARSGMLPGSLLPQAENYLLNKQILLPGVSVLERLIIRMCSEVHSEIFEKIYKQLLPELRQFIDHLLIVPEGKQLSLFYQLKEYPPASSISSIQSYLKHYQILEDAGIEKFDAYMLEPCFADYLFNRAQRKSRQQATEIFAALG